MPSNVLSSVESSFRIIRSVNSPLIATAIHDGHAVREDVAVQLAIDEQARLREEDPYTAVFAQIADTQVLGLRSRFEMDLNRSRDKAVYLKPEDAWGLQVWKATPSADTIAASLRQYDQFYDAMESLMADMISRMGRIVVYDIHSYNHRRDGSESSPADERSHPEINVGTGSMDREYWARVVDRFVHDVSAYKFNDRHLDVRENIKFRGGHFGRWAHARFPEKVCVISIEVKKFFMDEWTGQANLDDVMRLFDCLHSAVPGTLATLDQL